MSWQLETRSRTLSLLTADHTSEIAEIYGNKKIARYQHRDCLSQPQEFQQQLDLMLQQHEQRTAAYWLVKDQQGKLSGLVGLHSINWLNNSAQLTVDFLSGGDNIDLMYDSCWELVNLAFNSMKLHRIEAMVEASHPVLPKYLKSIHFVNEGLLPSRSMHNGKWKDYLVFSLLETDKAWKEILKRKQ